MLSVLFGCFGRFGVLWMLLGALDTSPKKLTKMHPYLSITILLSVAVEDLNFLSFRRVLSDTFGCFRLLWVLWVLRVRWARV